MEKINQVNLSGIYKTEAVTPTFTKQILEMNSKDRDGQWRPAQLDIYIKDDIKQAAGLQEGAEIRFKGWIAFNFASGGRAFPKVIVTEIEEVAMPAPNNQAGVQPAAGIPPVPDAMAPQTPAQNIPPVQPLDSVGAPQAPGIPTPPGMPQAPQAPGIPTPPQY